MVRRSPPAASRGCRGSRVWLLRLGVQPIFIEPGRPDQDGRHERFHETLKAETATPPRASIRAQQAAFAQSQRSCNGERPHETLGMRVPADVYTPSPRKMQIAPREHQYPERFEARRVRRDGSIKWPSEYLFVGEAMAGELVGLQLVEDARWHVFLGPMRLGVVHERSRTVLPLASDGQQTVSPMSPDRSVTHVPGCTVAEHEDGNRHAGRRPRLVAGPASPLVLGRRLRACPCTPRSGTSTRARAVMGVATRRGARPHDEMGSKGVDTHLSMVLTPMAGYAAKALGYLSLHLGAPQRVREIATHTGIPGPYLAKIVHQLGRRGIVRTRRGVGGGVELAVDPARMTLYELCEAIDDPVLEAQCLLGLGRCDDECACPAHELSTRLRHQKLEFLRRTTLADVGRHEESRRHGRTARRRRPKRRG